MRFGEETCKTCENNVISILSEPLDLYLQSVLGGPRQAPEAFERSRSKHSSRVPAARE